MTPLSLKPQEIPVDSPDSNCFFRPASDKPFVATPTALAAYGDDVVRCLVYRCRLDLIEIEFGDDEQIVQCSQKSWRGRHQTGAGGIETLPAGRHGSEILPVIAEDIPLVAVASLGFPVSSGRRCRRCIGKSGHE